MTKIWNFLLLVIFSLLLTSCQTVLPWERGYLAKPEMALKTYQLESILNSHIYFSKEASSVGGSASGPGCGCN